MKLILNNVKYFLTHTLPLCFHPQAAIQADKEEDDIEIGTSPKHVIQTVVGASFFCPPLYESRTEAIHLPLAPHLWQQKKTQIQFCVRTKKRRELDYHEYVTFFAIFSRDR